MAAGSPSSNPSFLDQFTGMTNAATEAAQPQQPQAGFMGVVDDAREMAQDASFATEHPTLNHAKEAFESFTDNLGEDKGKKMALAGAGVGALGAGAYMMRGNGLFRTGALAAAGAGVGLWAHNKLAATPEHEQGLGQMASTLFGDNAGEKISAAAGSIGEGAQAIGGRLMQEGRELGIPVDEMRGGVKHAGQVAWDKAQDFGSAVGEKVQEYGKPVLSHVQETAAQTFDTSDFTTPSQGQDGLGM